MWLCCRFLMGLVWLSGRFVGCKSIKDQEVCHILQLTWGGTTYAGIIVMRPEHRDQPSALSPVTGKECVSSQTGIYAKQIHTKDMINPRGSS